MDRRRHALYKYTKLEHVISSLNNGVYASKLTDFNDPYEYYGISDIEDYRVACLTRSGNAKLMWSHYANGHKGCTLQIDVPDDYLKDNFVLRPVEYSGIQARKGLSIHDGLYVKDKKWRTELEERAVWNRNSYDPALWKLINDKVYLNVRIKTVIFGCMAHEDNQYIEALKSIKRYNDIHKKQIKVKKLAMRADKFQFKLIKDFDYISEIKLYDKGKN